MTAVIAVISHCSSPICFPRACAIASTRLTSGGSQAAMADHCVHCDHCRGLSALTRAAERTDFAQTSRQTDAAGTIGAFDSVQPLLRKTARRRCSSEPGCIREQVLLLTTGSVAPEIRRAVLGANLPDGTSTGYSTRRR